MLFFRGQITNNRTRIVAIRDESPTAVEACARMFTDAQIVDDATVAGRLHAILAATEHRFIPGLHVGASIGMTGFRKEFEDPWPDSTDQVGHFLTAVRLAFDAQFLSNPIFPLLLGGIGDTDMPLRLIIGHEKKPDPSDVNKISLRTLITVLHCFHAQYRSVSIEDIANFLEGHLEMIQVGNGLGNSMADLRLSYKGWQFGHGVSEGKLKSNEVAAHWIRTEIGNG